MSSPPYEHRDDLETLEERLGYSFSDRTLLTEALTHRSYANETDGEIANNQRLEFLGDSVLGLVIADHLFHRFGAAEEGSLSSWLAALVNEGALSRVAEELDLGAFMMLGRGETMSGGRQKPSVLSDAYEAVLAAIYLDGGETAARDVILRLHASAIAECDREDPPEDHKSRLQRLVQAKGAFHPRYDIVAERGPAHERVFVAAVSVEDEFFGEGEGRSKKEAEQQAARAALKRWQDRESMGDT